MFLFILAVFYLITGILNLNTSHVLIYQRVVIFGEYVLEFKYISCSYLSKQSEKQDRIKSYLNTSHVLIYPALPELYFLAYIHLNTSHVLIYR